MGLTSHPRRAHHHGPRHRRLEHLGDPEAARCRTVTAAIGTNLGEVPRDPRLLACDFLHVDTVLLRGLCVLVLIHHDPRLLRIAAVTDKPVAAWVTKRARNLSMGLADQVTAVKFLIRDRDTRYAASFDAVFVAEGASVIRTPVQAPRANAICERVIGAIRRECLDRTSSPPPLGGRVRRVRRA